MDRLRTEEKAALLLAEADDDLEMNTPGSTLNVDQVTVIPKRSINRRRQETNSSHVILCFLLVLGAFILGCISGVIIMLYRISQEGGHTSNSAVNGNDLFDRINLNVDLNVRTKLFQSINSQNFVQFNRSNQIETLTAKEIYEQWKSFPSDIVRINQRIYDMELSKLSTTNATNTIEIVDSTSNQVVGKISALSKDSSMFLSSLVKSDLVESSSMFYVNYGREEDFAYFNMNNINLRRTDKAILFMKRKSSIITVTEQIRQAINYQCSALVLFDDNDDDENENDDENDQTITVKKRLSSFKKWSEFATSEERNRYLDGTLNDSNRKIPVLTISLEDVYKIFSFIQKNTEQWPSIPEEWHKIKKPIKLGGTLSNFKVRLSVEFQRVTVQSQALMAFIRGSVDQDHFILVGYRIQFSRQNKIINELIQSYANQIKQGWLPKRSILFCAWSSADYDNYAARRWLVENMGLINRYLIAYLDLGNDIMANATLNLHGSPLLEQVAHHAADVVASPLVHDHTCHHRQPTTKVPKEMHGENEEHHEHEHDHGRKRRDGDHMHSSSNPVQVDTDCEPHKLLDEWIKVNQNVNNSSTKMIPKLVQAIDPDSSAAIFQLIYGIPSLVIEMTSTNAISKDKFYVARSLSNNVQNIDAKVYLAYTQFISEIIRQLIDEPLIPFNLTFYADLIENQTSEYLQHYDVSYKGALAFHLGEPDSFNQTTNKLVQTIRNIQKKIDEMPKNDWIRLSAINKKLFEFERLFIFDDPLKMSHSNETKSKHILVGPAIGLTHTSVSFPMMSNILYGMPEDPPEELCDASKLFWIRFKKNIDSVRRTLTGVESLLNNIN